ncbi:MAG: SMC-Scp complex subunit ScpB [Gammaproteobacteria bacterium]
MEIDQLKNVIEAILLAAGRPLNIDQLLAMFAGQEKPERSEIRDAVGALQADYETRGIALIQVGSGYRIQVRETMQPWVEHLWEEKPARYSRALLETLALIAYRQPVTRGEIEDVRGVSVSSTIMKTLLEREWVHVVGHREVPGRPAMYGTTRKFLDYFSLKNLSELPSLAELRDLNEIGRELELDLSDIPGIGIELTSANDDEATVSEEESAAARLTDDVVSDPDTRASDNVANLH